MSYVLFLKYIIIMKTLTFQIGTHKYALVDINIVKFPNKY